MKHAVLIAGLTSVGLVFMGSPLRAATPVVTQVSQLIQTESCTDCTEIAVPPTIVAPAKRKIKVTHFWSIGVLH